MDALNRRKPAATTRRRSQPRGKPLPLTLENVMTIAGWIVLALLAVVAAVLWVVAGEDDPMLDRAWDDTEPG